MMKSDTEQEFRKSFPFRKFGISRKDFTRYFLIDFK